MSTKRTSKSRPPKVWTGKGVPGAINWPEMALLMTSAQLWSPGKDKWSLLINVGSYAAGTTTLDEKLMLDIAETINDRIRRWLYDYERKNPWHGFEVFEKHWRLLRTFVPLQFRLAVEQVLYEKGQPWSSLVTGFRPIEGR